MGIHIVFLCIMTRCSVSSGNFLFWIYLFIYGIFNDGASTTAYVCSNGRI